jgi:flagellar biosynthesis/type III secretory pathway chaperone
MSNATSTLRAFSDCVQRTLAVLQRLETALQTEQQALIGRDAVQLERAVNDKLAMLAELEPLVRERDAIQQQLEAPAGTPGGDHLLASAPPEAPIRRQWDELKTLAIAVEQLNGRNGQLAMQGEKAARFAVSLLTGRPSEPDTYGRKGQGKGGVAGLSLARA